MLSLDSMRLIYERLDAVLLPGGGDMNPLRYNATPEADIRLKYCRISIAL